MMGPTIHFKIKKKKNNTNVKSKLEIKVCSKIVDCCNKTGQAINEPKMCCNNTFMWLQFGIYNFAIEETNSDGCQKNNKIQHHLLEYKRYEH